MLRSTSYFLAIVQLSEYRDTCPIHMDRLAEVETFQQGQKIGEEMCKLNVDHSDVQLDEIWGLVPGSSRKS